MYSLLLLFFTIPLIFSHSFVRISERLVLENGIGNFESVKVSIFLFLLLSATIESIFFLEEKYLRPYLLALGGLIFFVLFEPFIFGKETLFGIGEKQHGSLFFGGLLWCYFLLKHLNKKSLHMIQYGVIFSSSIVAVTAIIEYLLNYNIFTGIVEDTLRSWGSGRATATLGNPNYVAGFLLMILPFLSIFENKGVKICLNALIFMGIISTGSVIGISLGAFFFLYSFLKRFKIHGIPFILLGIFILFVTLFGYFFFGTEKWLSLESRFILMKETLFALSSNMLNMFIGNGPNGIIEFYEGERSSQIEAYFPNNMIIDSSHNLFIDLLYKFGIFGSIGLGYIVVSSWKSLKNEAKISLLLGGSFFALNVTILSAYLMALYALSDKKEE